MRYKFHVIVLLIIIVIGSYPLNSTRAAGTVPADYYLIAIGINQGDTIGNVDDTDSGASSCTLRDAAGIVTAGTTTGPVNGCNITAIGAPDPTNPVYVVNYPPGLIYTIDMVNHRDEIEIAFNPVHIVAANPATDIIQGDSTLPLYGGSRMFNFFQSDSRLCNLTLRYGDGRGREGGTLINRAGELTLENVRIYGTDNLAAGAGLANTTSGTMNIIAGSIIGNQNEPNQIVGSIGVFGGAGILNWNSTMLIEDSTVHYNTTDQSRDGGGIDNESGTLTVRNSIIANNSLTDVLADGAGIYNRNGTLYIEGGQLYSNTTNGVGGGVYNDFLGQAQVTISGGAVIGGSGTPNYADEGGGIYNRALASLGGFVHIFDAEISYNTTNRGGGGIFNNAGQVDIGDADSTTIISNNVAGSTSGGGIYNSAGIVNITHTTLNNNQAIVGFGQGGGIINAPSNGGAGSAILNITDSSLNGNEANIAGGGINNVGTESIVTLNATSLTNNTTTTGSGGGIANSNEAQLFIQNGSTIGGDSNGNDAGYRGGGIFNSGATVMISDSEVSYNTSTDGNGGGIYNTSQFVSGGSDLPATMTLANSLVNHNQTINGGLFNPDGGGIYNSAASLIIIDTSLNSNTAAGMGGGLVNEDGTVNITGGMISGNQAGEDGGGLFNHTQFSLGAATTSTNILDTTLLNNNAVGNGGAIYNEADIYPKNAEVTVTDSRIGSMGNANTASLGGAIYNATDNLFKDPAVARVTVTGSYIEGNSAGFYHFNATTQANYSCIEDNGAGFINDTPASIQNARNNWWGAADGPSDLGGSSATGSGDGVTAGVDFSDFNTRGCMVNSDGGFVTGGGWIDSPEGAYIADPMLTGKASFGFVSKYKKGAIVPTGQTEFHFQTADLNFHSNSYEWLIVTGSNYAKFKGEGTINGEMAPNEEAYKFQVWAGDNNPDTFRIKIWYEEGNTEIREYDNGTLQEIGGGSIVIHTKST